MNRPPISILIPAYGASAPLRNCLASLAQFAPPACFIYVLDDATPFDGVRETCEQMATLLPQLRYVCSDVHRGFVGACNWGCESVREPQSDVLLLHSDTEATAGFLEEMQAVLYLHERHGVILPRSNNATVFSVPLQEAGFDAADSSAVWQQVSHLLPRYHVMPTAASFCMLVKSEILDRFGLFDESYAPGFYEEDDFVCRINRCGLFGGRGELGVCLSPPVIGVRIAAGESEGIASRQAALSISRVRAKTRRLRTRE